MTDMTLDRAWWPPDPEAPIGEARARELVAALQPIIGPVVDAAEADLRQRINPGAESVRSRAPPSYFVNAHLGPEMRARCVGTVYEAGTGDPQRCSIHPHRDGPLRVGPV